MDAIITFKPHVHLPLQTLDRPSLDLLTQSLNNLVTSCPPEQAALTTRNGFYQGPTSIAYLFFHLSRSHPHLSIRDQSPLAWFESYLSHGGPDSNDSPVAQGIGIVSEYFCHLALSAAHTQNAELFVSAVSAVTLTDIQEVLLGSAGLLILLRFVREFVPTAKPQMDKEIARVIAHIAASPWLFHGREYTGAAHGNAGIIAQVCLSDPSAAPTVHGRLATLLDMQLDNGNWYSTTDRKHEHMQWCHGLAGILASLLAVEKYFIGSDLETKIRGAIEKGRELVWEKGIIGKEPCLCHGVTGNALVLDGAKREHFLSFATPETIGNGEWEASQDPAGLYCGEAGRAWVWAMIDGGREGFPAYTC